VLFLREDSGEMLDMKKLSVVGLLKHSVTPTFLSAAKSAENNPNATHTRLSIVAALLFLSSLPLSSHSISAASGKTGGAPATGSKSCGVAALARLSDFLQVGPEAREKILGTPAPEGGFSLAELKTLAAKNGMRLEAVRQPANAEIIIPSIVLWKIGHYGVITEKRGTQYRIVDGQSTGVWLGAQTIQQNSSGNFLVPEQLLPAQWSRLGQGEAAGLRGEHTCPDCSLDFPDDEDPPPDCCDDNDD
jgi:hypothetical protein